MKLPIAAFLVVSTFVPVLAVDCYVKAFDDEGFDVTVGGIEKFREFKRQGFWKMKIAKGCNHCSYELNMHVPYGHKPVGNDFAQWIQLIKMWEHWGCIMKPLEDDDVFKRECHAPEFYKTVTNPGDTQKDLIKCNTDLCNIPCYPDPVLPLPSDPPPKRYLVDCYVLAPDVQSLEVYDGGIEQYRKNRRDGTFTLKIEKDCHYCTYDFEFIVNYGFKEGRYLYKMREYFRCSHEKFRGYDNDYNRQCHAETFYKTVTGPVNEEKDSITCRTNLCNKPCYPDPVLPLPSTDPPPTAPPPTIPAQPVVSYDDINELNNQSNSIPSPKPKPPSNDVSSHNFSAILVLVFITELTVLLCQA